MEDTKKPLKPAELSRQISLAAQTRAAKESSRMWEESRRKLKALREEVEKDAPNSKLLAECREGIREAECNGRISVSVYTRMHYGGGSEGRGEFSPGDAFLLDAIMRILKEDDGYEVTLEKRHSYMSDDDCIGETHAFIEILW